MSTFSAQPPSVDPPADSIASAGDLAQESLATAVRGAFRVLAAILIVLFVLYLLSGVFQIQSGEQGLIVRFGKLVGDEGGAPFTEGWKLARPDPFDEKLRLSGEPQTIEIDTFCFARAEQDLGKPLSEIRFPTGPLNPGTDGAMLSGDKNLSHGLWTVQYKVRSSDGKQFVENIGDSIEAAEPLVRRLVETAIMRAVAHRTVEEVTRTDRLRLAAEVQRRLQKALDKFESGIEIEKVIGETGQPGRVQPAFLAVTQAAANSQLEIESAGKQASETLNQTAGAQHAALTAAIRDFGNEQNKDEPDPRELAAIRARIDTELDNAGGQVAVFLGAARASASTQREQIRRETEQFDYYYNQYRQHPRVAKIRRWVEMRDAVLRSLGNEIFFVSGDNIEILTNRDEERAIELDAQRYLKSKER